MNFKDAKQLSDLSLALANQKKVAIAISVADSHGELVMYHKMDAVSYHAAYLSQCKAYTAAREMLTSSQVGAYAKNTAKDLANWCDSKITGIAGGVPIFSGYKVIGSLGIAGLKEAEDEEFAYEVIKNFSNTNSYKKVIT
ncbi:GlcG/HbpS family heme-binding protein [Colwellia echini]|uniref:Heme-binding protein n=1 Tax=Colwellia echini TaxID=1982103 RepID=A0ABY3N1D5_9GAMM|nr:heme-binding protein [Colwellia echini]TYK67229.1 heme-binding protein [Colwellia echini]